jgi:hypothetical protein
MNHEFILMLSVQVVILTLCVQHSVSTGAYSRLGNLLSLDLFVDSPEPNQVEELDPILALLMAPGLMISVHMCGLLSSFALSAL